MADRLRAHRRYSANLPCYLCAQSTDISADHAAPQKWVYRGALAPIQWPTAPICDRCKRATDPADNELHHFVVVRSGSGSPFWPRFRSDLHKAGPLLRQVLRRTETGWDGIAGQVRGIFRSDEAQVGVAVEKLARGLTWIIGDEMPRPSSAYAWGSRIGSEFLFEGDFSVREYEFGPRFRCAVGDLSPGRRWHITYGERVHFAIEFPD